MAPTKLSLNEVVIASAVRTPIGSFKGTLASVPATELGAICVRAAVERAGIPPEEVKEVFMGNVCASAMRQAPARQAAIFGGLSKSTICTTVNKVCSSGMKTILLAVQGLQTGTHDVILAGGMESMSNIPFLLKRDNIPLGGSQLLDAILYDCLTDVYNEIHMGDCGEHVAKTFNFTREQQDDYAIAGYKKVAAAYEANAFADELVPVPVPQKKGAAPIIISEDEDYKKVDFEKLRKLPPVFQENGTITAANAAALNDGGAAMILMTAEAAQRLNVKPLARVIGYADAECDPIDFPIAPTLAIPKLLEKTGVKKEDIALWEINEPFSIVGLGAIKILGLDPAKINIHGGGVALGHPIGTSGNRIVGHLCHVLKKGEKGVAAVCNGGGGATSIMIEKL